MLRAARQATIRLAEPEGTAERGALRVPTTAMSMLIAMNRPMTMAIRVWPLYPPPPDLTRTGASAPEIRMPRVRATMRKATTEVRSS